MNRQISFFTPIALVVGGATSTYAIEYLSVTQAQHVCFPQADHFAPANIEFTAAQIRAIQAASGQRILARGQQVWKAKQGERLLGYFIIDYVIGKHLAIDYAVAISSNGEVRDVEILEYRESYGAEIRGADWRKQFAGKTARSRLSLNDDILNISGATLSSRHVTEGVKRVLATYEICLK